MHTSLTAVVADQRRADLRADAEAYRRARASHAAGPHRADAPADAPSRRRARRFWHWLATAQL